MAGERLTSKILCDGNSCFEVRGEKLFTTENYKSEWILSYNILKLGYVKFFRTYL